MRRRSPSFAALLAAAVTFAACAPEREAAEPPTEAAGRASPRPAAPPLAPAPVEGFAHQAGVDLFGYYFPITEVEVGALRLSHLFIGASDEFTAWESGRGERDLFAPVMLQFDDTTSPLVGNELGGEGYSVTQRVLPQAYAISEGSVRFAGRHPVLGEVTFDGRFDPEALRAAQAGGGEAPVLRGMLVVGDRTFEGQAFRWHGGD